MPPKLAFPRQTAALTTLACALIAGCGELAAGGASANHVQASSRRSTAPAGHTTAPIAFAASRGIPLPSAVSLNTNLAGNQIGPPPIALAGDTIFVTTGTSVLVVDGATGALLGAASPQLTVPSPTGQGDGYAGSAAAPPLIADLQGQSVALAGYVVEKPGHGTTPPSLAIEIDAINANGQRLWNILAALPGQPSALVGTPAVTFIGSTSNDVIATLGDSDDGFSTIAFDIAQRKLLWASTSFLAQAVVGTVVIGTFDSSAPWALGTHNTPATLSVAAVSVQTGQTDWRHAAMVNVANIQQAGSGTALTEAQDPASGDDVIALVNASTGNSHIIARQPNDLLSANNPLPWTCQYDDQVTVVCSDSTDASEPHAFALDGDTGQLLWQLPDVRTNRVAPAVTTAYDGAVYGTTESGPVVLSARSGEDVNDSPGVSPVTLDPEIGIAESNDDGLEAYPATHWSP